MLTREETAGTTVEILAPYLPYGIQIEYSNWYGRPKGKLLGLSTHDVHNAILVDFGGVDGRGEAVLDFKYSLPCLLPFSALCEPLEDGTIPAVELAKILIGGSDDEYHYEAGKSEYGGGFIVLADIDGEQVYQLDLRPNWDWWLSDYLAQANHEEITVRHPAEAIDYLRSNHFAVDLEPHQYIAKFPAPTSAIEEDKT